MTFDKVSLEVVHEDAASLAAQQEENHEAFALIRRVGFGASDSSVLLNVNPFNNIDDLIKQKASDEITEDEIKVGLKPTVRMGSDLEDFVLQKFCKWADLEVEKPKAMYRIAEFPYLTVNFDGIIEGIGIPVEVKVVSQWAEKYWDHSKAIDSLIEGTKPRLPADRFTTDYAKALAAEAGIPIYYYTQCQQQILAANSMVCYLAAMHVKDWTMRVYPVYRNELVINQIKSQGYTNWKKVERRRNAN